MDKLNNMQYHPQFPYANFPIWVVGATALGWNSLKVSKLVCAVCMLPFPVRINGSTRTELKCRTSRRDPSLMNPFRGDAHPSPTVWRQFRSALGS